MVWGRARKFKDIAARFVAATNARDIDALASLMADDFTYIDSWREGIVGRDAVIAASKDLFAMDPEFRIDVERTVFRDPHVMMSGTVTSGRFGKGRRAVWRARCEGEKIGEWQSWAQGNPPPMVRTIVPDQALDLSDRAGDAPDL